MHTSDWPRKLELGLSGGVKLPPALRQKLVTIEIPGDHDVFDRVCFDVGDGTPREEVSLGEIEDQLVIGLAARSRDDCVPSLFTAIDDLALGT